MRWTRPGRGNANADSGTRGEERPRGVLARAHLLEIALERLEIGLRVLLEVVIVAHGAWRRRPRPTNCGVGRAEPVELFFLCWTPKSQFRGGRSDESRAHFCIRPDRYGGAETTPGRHGVGTPRDAAAFPEVPSRAMSPELDASSVSTLPDEVLRLVFASFDDPATLVRCEATCTWWRKVIGDAGDLWMRLYAARWRDFSDDVSPRERPASSPPRVDPVAASILDAHGSWRRLVTARAEVEKIAEALVDSMVVGEHRASAREDARELFAPDRYRWAMHAVRHHFWSEERYLTRARYGLELLPSLAEFDALAAITREIGDGSAGDVANAESTRRCVEVSERVAAVLSTLIANDVDGDRLDASARMDGIRRAYAADPREALDALDVVGAEFRRRLASAGLDPATAPVEASDVLSHLLFSEKTTDTEDVVSEDGSERVAVAGDGDGADAGTSGGGAGFRLESSTRGVVAAPRAGGLGLTGNRRQYYDRRNSSLHQVFRRGLGIPIALSIVYAGVGRRGGLDVRFMNVPGHFVCGVRGVDADGDASWSIRDPFHGGSSLTREGSIPEETMAPEYTRGLHPAAVITRMLFNVHIILQKTVKEVPEEHDRFPISPLLTSHAHDVFVHRAVCEILRHDALFGSRIEPDLLDARRRIRQIFDADVAPPTPSNPNLPPPGTVLFFHENGKREAMTRDELDELAYTFESGATAVVVVVEHFRDDLARVLSLPELFDGDPARVRRRFRPTVAYRTVNPTNQCERVPRAFGRAFAPFTRPRPSGRERTASVPRPSIASAVRLANALGAEFESFDEEECVFVPVSRSAEAAARSGGRRIATRLRERRAS